MTEKRKNSETGARVGWFRLVLGGIVLLAMAGGLLAALMIVRVDTSSVSSSSEVQMSIPGDVSELELTNRQGEPFAIADLSHDYTLMSFGYTHCPDVCPLTLSDYRRVKRALPEDAREQVGFAFVSVDGERDTPAVLDSYIGRFDEDFIGLTSADESEIQQVTNAFGVFYERRTIEGSRAAYMVDHTASLFLLNAAGDVVRVFPFGTPPDEIAAEIAARL